MSQAQPGTPQLHWGERRIALPENATVLEALESADIATVSGCRAGACGKCLQRARGSAPAHAQRGLKSTLASQGYFYACQARISEDLRIEPSTPPEPIAARVIANDALSADVHRLRLRPDGPFEYEPGQYLDVLHPDGHARSYSIASHLTSGELELHVRQISSGRLSPWLCGLPTGASLALRGPFGQCFYTPDANGRKLLLVGAGTGLAPLLGIARQALFQGHRGAIDLIHGGLIPARLYMRQELSAWAAQEPQLRVHACVLRDAGPGEHEGALDQVSLRLAGSTAETRVFLCGDDGLVRQLQRSFFLAGVPSAEIFADPFLPAAEAP